MSQHPLSITQVVSRLKNILEKHPELQNIECVGEVSNFTKSRVGHWYFSLKDERAKINCVMFYSSTLKVNADIKVGDEVLIKGHISIYSGTGQVQIIVSEMSHYGQGMLYQRYLNLRNELHKKGYFNQDHKKTIPLYPFTIGVVVGKDSAAQADILKTLKTRWPVAKVNMYESLVQGDLAAAQLIEKLTFADQDDNDVIILARGGGSLEDLWAFNDVNLVYCIYEMKTPVITGVGHEIDITLVDYVADQRGLTPTDAAMIATPNLSDVLKGLKQLSKQLNNRVHLRLKSAISDFNQIYQTSLLSRPEMLLADRHYQLKDFEQSLLNYSYQFKTKKHLFEHQQQRLFSLTRQISQKASSNLLLKQTKMQNIVKEKLILNKQGLDLLRTQLELKSPLNIMSKGYILSYQNDKIVKYKQDIKFDKPLKLRYQDGDIVVHALKEDSHGEH